MEIITYESAPKVSPHIDGRIVYTGKEIEMVHLTLAPGEKVSEHINSIDVVFFILDGKVIFNNDDETTYAEKNTSIFVRSGTKRSIENISEHPSIILITKIKQR